MDNLPKKGLLLLILIFLFSPIYFLQGAQTETKESLTSKMNDTQKQIEILDKEIKQYQDQISTTNQESQTLLNLIKELSLTRNKLSKETALTAQKINLTNNKIVGLQGDIQTKNEKIDTTQLALKKSLFELYQSDQTSFLESILDKRGLSDVSMEYQNKIALNSKINSFIKENREAKKILEEAKDKKELEQKTLHSLKDTLVHQQQAIDIAKSEKDKVLKETKNKEAAYKKLLAENQKKRDNFQKEFSDYESKLKFLLDIKLLPQKGSGVLAWPLDKVFITQLFGKTGASGRLYASGSHSGVDFRATIGTPVRAMGTGVVLGTGNTDTYCKGASFGKWVFIQYDNGLSSTFGHLSKISAKVNDKVVAGDIVGLSGNTGHSTGPHLHVTVYASQGAQVTEFPSKSCPGANFVMPIAPTTAYLDPILYLPATTSDIFKKDAPRD